MSRRLKDCLQGLLVVMVIIAAYGAANCVEQLK